MPGFSHLHCHSQYSLLDGAARIEDMFLKASADGMKAVALTDHGNMFGIFKFVNEGLKQHVKPIIGCEFYLVEDRHRKSFIGDTKDKRYHQLILAKNQEGYHNLSKLCSLGYTEGLYSKWPRIDKEILKKFSGGLIATSCCIGAEIPQAIIHKGEKEAEGILKEYLEIFGEDYYIELQRHGLENIDGTGISQEEVNRTLMKFAKRHNLKLIATNDSHYVDEQDWNAHDILLCVNTGSKQAEPIGEGRGFRFGFQNHEFYFKTQEEMSRLFVDVPEALDNTNLIVDSIETPELSRDVLLPNYVLPNEFSSQIEYLRFLAFEGARKKYVEISSQVSERLEFELKVIEDSGYPGYFLIVQDFTSAARNMGVWVGPGRGSAAGSVVAYALGITNVDPLAYNLLFERFLNPERVSMPDIDIDFDDEGRQKVIDYVLDKYGREQVAQIVTYGSMAARSSLRDVGRVLDVPLPVVDKVAKAFPNHLKASLQKVLNAAGVDPKLKSELNSEQLHSAMEFRKLADQKDDVGNMIRLASKLEGSVRNTGIHACGVIITPQQITNYIPVSKTKDNELLITQFDNSVVESAGLLKMDFLGLKTLSIIKSAVELVKSKHGVDIVPDDIPLDDQETLKLFARGNTNGIFQFESPGMQKNLKALQPDKFEDLIAMNALYRPGPMEYIKNFIARKQGREDIQYDLPEMEEFLADTYGITVYQEQVMLLSQKLSGFTKGQADSLRKAMGKKKKEEMDKLFDLFIHQGSDLGHPENKLRKIWKDWEAFASYAFNKSHSTCYAYLAFHTAYLKAHYPAEFMASVLTHNMSDIKKVSFFMEECKRQNIEILGPDVNESAIRFSVNNKGAIRFGLAAIKGVGESAAEELMKEREENGEYRSIFDLCRRINHRALNRKAMENLATAGAFDAFGLNRSSYLETGEGLSGLDEAIRFGLKVQELKNSAQTSLFGGSSGEDIAEPKIELREAWGLLERLHKEKELIGVYISGHPLDKYKFEMEFLNSHSLLELDQQGLNLLDRDILVSGLVTGVRESVSKGGKPYMIFTLEDYSGSREIGLFGEKCASFRGFVVLNAQLYIKARGDKSYRDSDKLELNIMKIGFLENIVDEELRSLTINLPVERLDENLMLDLFELSDERGKVTLSFKIHTEEAVFEASSRRYRIRMDDVTKRKLEALDLSFRMN